MTAASPAAVAVEVQPLSPADLVVVQAQKPLTLQLKPGQTQYLRLDVEPGSLVRGNLQGLGVVLEVQTVQGQHLRRLTQGVGVDHSFTWQSRGKQERLVLRRVDGMDYVPASGEHVSKFPAPRAGAVRLNIAQVMPVLDEGPPQAAQEATTVGARAPTLRSPTLKALQKHMQQGGDTERFWRDVAQKGSPLVEPWGEKHVLVSFLWRGANRSVRLFGSPSGNHDPLQRLDGSDVWWSSFVMPTDARLSYGLAPDVPQVSLQAGVQRRAILSTLQRDPLNPMSWGSADQEGGAVDAYAGRSVLTLPKAPPQPWVKARKDVAAGQLQRHWLASEALGNGRDVWIYRPQGWQEAATSERSLLVLFDAHAYLQQVPTTTIIDNLMADGLLPATAVVLLANGPGDARGRELPPNPDFARFMGETLMPWLQQQGVEVPAQRTVIAGSSYGGLASSYVAFQYPQRFGNVLSLSGSYWWAPQGEAPNWMARQYEKAKALPVRFYIDAGVYEGARGGQAGILETSQDLANVLRSRGYAVHQRQHSTGHDYVHWQGSLACGLLALQGRAPSSDALRKRVHQACLQ